jgi:hypothetical protein
MKRSCISSERLAASETSEAALAASMFAASVGMIWDLATGHASAFDRLLSDLTEDQDRDEPENFKS